MWKCICGFENHDVAKVCNQCSTRRESLEGDQASEQAQAKYRNRIGVMLEKLAVFILGMGLIVSYLNADATAYVGGKFHLDIFLKQFFVTFVAFALIKGFAEVIHLLQGIRQDLKR